MPPPPPPPPPPPGMGGPPPPPPPGGLPPPPAIKARGGLLADITKGKQLKKAVTNDRSAPIVATTSSSTGSGPVGGAPPVPGAPRPPGGLAPPAPGNRARSNSDQNSRDASSSTEAPPQLGGLFAGGMPKLKSRGGGINTGANRESSYTSDPESSRGSAPKPPTMSAPRPPTAAAPRLPPPTNQRPIANIPSLANLKRTNLAPDQRPMSSASSRGPPPPIGKKPPPPPGSRKPSSPAPPPPPALAPPPPIAPPGPPSAPRHPPPPPTSPPASNGAPQSLAMQAAKRAASEAIAPRVSPPLPPAFSAPPPPPAAPLPPPFHAPASPAPTPSLQAPAAPPPRLNSLRSMLDPSSYTLSSNGNGQQNNASTTRKPVASRGSVVAIEDSRWKFQSENVFPAPRAFQGGARRYRAGRGSSVPLDLSAYQ